MRKRLALVFACVCLLPAILVACGRGGVATSIPVATASIPVIIDLASATLTSAAPGPGTTPTPLGVAPTRLRPATVLSPSPPSVTVTSIPTEPSVLATGVSTAQSGTATPVPMPPTQTATLTPVPMPPTRTPTPVPTATPTAKPSPRPSSVGGPAGDPVSVRVELQRTAGGLDTPVGIANAGDGSGRLFIVEKAGRIRALVGSTFIDAPFLDITDRVGSSANEQGLLGLAFHPNFANNGRFFVNYTNGEGNTVIARFSVGADPAQADPSSEVVLLTVNQPAANHNGGHLAFGPDGYLYVGLGDGGGSGDQFANGQNGGTLLGAMLRLDVDAGQPYGVPASNPFVGDTAVRDEIWAIGLRNPWRYSFDRLTGDLYIGDVGQNRYEEIDFQPGSSDGGENYGWPVMEGVHCFPENKECGRAGLTLPEKEYDHSQGCSVTGGYVYRGQEFPLLTGIYVFGDYCSGKIWGLAASDDGGWTVAQLAQADLRLSSFGEDEAGELYLVDMRQGELFKIGAIAR